MTHWSSNYIGLPWIPAGRGPAAYDCWGLLWSVYRNHFGLEIAKHVGHDSTQVRGNIELFHEERDRWVKVREPKEGDAVAISAGTRFHHVGIWTEQDGGMVVHSLQGRGVIAQTIAGLKTLGLNHIKFYRLKK